LTVTTVASGPSAAGGRAGRTLLWAAAFGALALLVVYPVFWLVVGSFQTEFGDWTLEHYAEVFSPYYLKLLWNSLVYALLSTAIAMLIGVPMAWAVARTDMPGKAFFRAASAVTFVLPPLFQAMAFVVIFQPNAGLMNVLFEALFGVKPFNIFSFTGLVLVTACGAFPQSFMLVDSALRSMDPALEEAATTAGASRWRVTTRITLPLVLPAILTAMNLTIINNLVVFGPAALIGIPAKIFVMASQIYVELTAFPPRLEFTAALAMLFLTFAALLLTFQVYVLRRRSFSTIVGKGMRPRELALGRWRWLAFVVFALMIFTALILPAAVLVYLSFSKIWTNWFATTNFTLAHFENVLFTRTQTLAAIRNTLLLALATVATTLSAGFVLAYIIVKTRARARQILNYLTFLPYSVPGAVFTVGVILAFIRPPLVLYGTLWILVACYFARFLPFAIQPLSAALRQIDNSLLEAGRVVGAGWWRATQRITLPLVKFSVFSTVMLVFVACLREVVSAILLAAPDTETMMVTAFRMWEEGLIQETAALMVVLLALVLAFFWIVRRAIGERMFN
jgi:iron(III) transport system permease protein